MEDIEEEAQRAALQSFGDIIRRKRQAPQWTTKELAEKDGDRDNGREPRGKRMALPA